MEFRVLGPLEVWSEGRMLDLPGSKRRTLLAVLVLHANELVPASRLIDELWADRPPANASAALQNHISRLRKELGADLLETQAGGYILRADPNTVDARRFERLVAEAKPLPASERRAQLAQALALWRGPALGDLGDEPAVSGDTAQLEELRMTALEQRIDADLELGDHENLVPELERLVAAHRFRERLHGQLILALYRSARQAEALEHYRETRRVLVDELGIEPSHELRELEHAILRQDPALAARAPTSATVQRRGRRRLVIGASVLSAAVALILVEQHGRGPAVLGMNDARKLAAVTVDDFEDGVLDPRLWDKELNGRGVQLAERAGRLEMSIDATASVGPYPPGVHANIESRVWTQCRLVGDFDVGVDYELLQWAREDGVVVEFAVASHLRGEDWAGLTIDRRSIPGQNGYVGWRPPNVMQFAGSSDLKGAFRVTRVGSELTAYYKVGRPDYYKSSWRQLATWRPAGAIRPVVVFLDVLSPSDAFGHRAAKVAFDNFAAAAEKRSCD